MGDEGDNFLWGIKNGDLATVKDFVGREKKNVNTRINGRLPLHYAADYGQLEVIEFLLKQGAEINAPDKFDITPLLSAIFEGHTKCVKLLLEQGADASGKSPDGSSYEDCAEKSEIKELLKSCKK